MGSKQKKIALGVLVALLFSFTIVLVAPLHVQTNNQLEFAYSSAELFKALLPFFVIILAGLSVLLASLRVNAYQILLSVLFALSLLLWLQGNILVWDYGALDGREIDWAGMWFFGLLDSTMWVLGLGLAIRYSNWMARNLVGVGSIFLILIQCVSMYSDFSTTSAIDRVGKYRVDTREKLAFSRDKNVVVIVVDAFQTDVFQELIDEEPVLRDVFDGFVYFRNSVSGFRQSYPSIPNILTATYFDNKRPMWDYLRDAYMSESSLPKFFRDNGYRSEVYESPLGLYVNPAVVTNAVLNEGEQTASYGMLHNIDVALFRYLPHFMKKLIYNNQLWLLSRWFPSNLHDTELIDSSERPKQESFSDTEFIDLSDRPKQELFSDDAMKKLGDLRFADRVINHSRVAYTQPAFKFYHMMGTHLPIRMDRNFDYVEPTPNRASMKELARGVIGLLGLIMNSFRELGIFEESLIVVVADHGMWSNLGSVKIPEHITQLYGDNGSFPPADLPELKGTALPLVMIKRIGEQGAMQISDSPVELTDIPRTIVSEIGFDGSSFPGKSMFDLTNNEPRQRRVYFATFKSNPAYSEPYRSTMTEFQVDGFSWLDKSWRKTGKSYPPAGGD